MKSNRQNAMKNWDFNFPAELTEQKVLIEFLRSECKFWNFQKEYSKSKYLHWQIRLVLHTKLRQCEFVKELKAIGARGRLSPTSEKCWRTVSKHRFYEYCQKDRTRVEGPWRDESDTEWFPDTWKQNAARPYPYQKQIGDSCGPNRDHVNVIVNPDGMEGKTETAGILQVWGKRVYDFLCTEKPNRMVYTFCSQMIAAQDRNPDLVFFDIPRGMHENAAWCGLLALENLTRQQITDSRYRSNTWRFNCPARWVMTNRDPIVWKDKMSKGRWVIWDMQADNSLKLRADF